LSTNIGSAAKDTKFFSPEIIRISNRVFVIVYMTDQPHRGMLTTILTDDPNTHTINDATYTSITSGPPELRVTKSAILAVDADNNNVVSPGDNLRIRWTYRPIRRRALSPGSLFGSRQCCESRRWCL
jgi:hypothetical protein